LIAMNGVVIMFWFKTTMKRISGITSYR